MTDQPVQEPVAWLYPEGLEALQAGKCWTAYPTEHEDCNIPLYTSLSQQQAELTPPDDDSVCDAWLSASDSAGIAYDGPSFERGYKLGQIADRDAAEKQQAEPVAWDKPSTNFNEWWDGDRRRDNANPFTTDSFAYWAWEGWQAAQRPWVGLTEQERNDLEDALSLIIGKPAFDAIDAALKERNT